MRHDEYVTIEVEFKTATPRAVLVAKDGEEEEWIPRSLLAWSSDRELDNYTRGTMIDLKILEWKATQLGWI